LKIKKDLIYQQLLERQETLQREVSESEYNIRLEEETLLDLQDEVINVIRGTSAFGSVLLTQLMNKSEARIVSQKNDLIRRTDELLSHDTSVQEFDNNYRDLSASLSSFAELLFVERQQLLGRCIKRIYVDRNYNFKIDWAFSPPES
jgi:hypothetical protein